MFGPGYGHNAWPFLDYFQHHPEHQLTYVLTTPWKFEHSRESFAPVKVVDLKSFWLQLLPMLYLHRYDLIWYHGGNDPRIMYLVNRFKPRSSYFTFNVWGHFVLKSALGDSVRGQYTRKVINTADCVHCNWYATLQYVEENFPDANTAIFPWGLNDDHFAPVSPENELQEETIRFLGSIDREKTNFFYPKSLTPWNRHDLIIEASKLLVERGCTDFHVCFWHGNIVNDESWGELEAQIESSKLANHIKLIRHSFLPQKDLMAVWDGMDCGLSVLDHDQLSTTFLEPMLRKKENIASKIPSYQKFNENFDTDLCLVENSAEAIADAMEATVGGVRSSAEVLEKRRTVLETEFRFDTNISKALEFYSSGNKSQAKRP